MHIHIAFGANLGDREENIHQAVQLMSQHVGHLVRCSSLIETAPVDMLSDNAFLNAVAIFDTKLSPGRILLHFCARVRVVSRCVWQFGGCDLERASCRR